MRSLVKTVPETSWVVSCTTGPSANALLSGNGSPTDWLRGKLVIEESGELPANDERTLRSRVSKGDLSILDSNAFLTPAIGVRCIIVVNR
jgi:hypothetical protein